MVMEKDLKILREYYDIYIPQALRDFDDYDFIADNTFLAGIVWHVIEGKYSKFIGPGYEEYVDDDYQIAKKRYLKKIWGMTNIINLFIISKCMKLQLIF